MPRGKRSTPAGEEPRVPRRRGRPRKTPEAAPPDQAPEPQAEVLPLPAAQASTDQDAKLAEAEAEITRKYPDRRFKPGSLLLAGALEEFGHKRTVIILCSECDAERRVATLDIFHVSRCVECTKKPRSKKAKKGGDK